MMISLLQFLANEPQQPEDQDGEDNTPRLMNETLPVMPDKRHHKDHNGFPAHNRNDKRTEWNSAYAGGNINERRRCKGKTI